MLDWDKYIAVANRFQYRARPEDREDLAHDIILKLAEVACANGDTLSEGAMVRVASFTVMSYWRDVMRRPTILSLDREVYGEDGDTFPLLDTLADDKALDLDAWLDARTWLLGCPARLVMIANKISQDKPLSNKEHQYLWRYRHKEQRSLVVA